MSKWIALSLIVVGFGLIVAATRMDGHTSYEEGGFLLEIAGFGLGGALMLGGLIWFAVLLFMGL